MYECALLWRPEFSPGVDSQLQSWNSLSKLDWLAGESQESLSICPVLEQQMHANMNDLFTWAPGLELWSLCLKGNTESPLQALGVSLALSLSTHL